MKLFVSPHLDDAVLSCGEKILRSEALVATVFAGGPDDPTILSAHDAECGFRSAQEAILIRRMEDLLATKTLGASAIWGDLPETVYRNEEPIDPGLVAEFLRPLIQDAEAVYAPLGLQHPDHVIVADVAWQIARAYDVRLVVYEEIPYRAEMALLDVAQRVHDKHLPEWADCDVPPRGGVEMKKQAVDCYTSQLPSLDLDSCFVRERFWRLRMKEWQ